jgi:hypothetical protein
LFLVGAMNMNRACCIVSMKEQNSRRRDAYQVSSNGSNADFGVPSFHDCVAARVTSRGSLVSSSLRLVRSRYFEETWFQLLEACCQKIRGSETYINLISYNLLIGRLPFLDGFARHDSEQFHITKGVREETSD